jgi:hypothetical protein
MVVKYQNYKIKFLEELTMLVKEINLNEKRILCQVTESEHQVIKFNTKDPVYNICIGMKIPQWKADAIKNGKRVAYRKIRIAQELKKTVSLLCSSEIDYGSPEERDYAILHIKANRKLKHEIKLLEKHFGVTVKGNYQKGYLKVNVNQIINVDCGWVPATYALAVKL